MGLAVEIFFACAGIVYILWQVHTEYKGALGAAGVIFACFSIFAFVIPHIIGKIAELTSAEFGMLLVVVYLIFMVIGGFWLIEDAPEKWRKEEAEKVAAIWKEVDELPLPDQKIIDAYKARMRLPFPTKESDQKLTEHAINAWRRSEFNKRYNKKIN